MEKYLKENNIFYEKIGITQEKSFVIDKDINISVKELKKLKKNGIIITMALPLEIKQLIMQGIPDATIEIKDLAGDNNHYSAIIKSKLFKGMSKIDQHKLVYKSLKGKMGNELHALAIKTEEK